MRISAFLASMAIILVLAGCSHILCLQAPDARYSVYFNLDSVALSGSARQTLKKVAMSVSDASFYDIKLTSRTDALGDADMNMRLSMKRAEQVKAALVRYGVNENRVRIIAQGEQDSSGTNAKERVVVVAVRTMHASQTAH